MGQLSVYILNDTRGSWHTGSDAVMSVLERLCAEANLRVVGRHPVGVEQLPQDLDRADLVLVNGEGTLHHGKGGHLIRALGLAQRNGQKTALVNTVWHHPAPAPLEWGVVLGRCDLLVARDPLSFEALRKRGARPHLIPDLALECWGDQGRRSFGVFQLEPQSQVLIGKAYVHWLRELEPDGGDGFALCGHPTYRHSIWRKDGPPRFWDAVVDLRESASPPVAYVTGEHHGCYAAILAGVPFVPIPGNCWKVEGLVAWPTKTTYPVEIATDADGVLRGIRQAREQREQFAAWREEFLAWPHMTAEVLRSAVE